MDFDIHFINENARVSQCKKQSWISIWNNFISTRHGPVFTYNLNWNIIPKSTGDVDLGIDPARRRVYETIAMV